MYLKNKFFMWLCCAIVLPLNSVFAQTETTNFSMLTFEDAASYLSLNSYVLKQSDKLIKQKEQEQKATFGLHLPKVFISANYVLMSDDIHLDMNPVKDAITPLYSTLGNYGNFSGVPNPDPATAPFVPTLPDDISTQAVRKQLLEGLDQLNASDWTTVIQEKQFGMVNAGFSLPLYTGGKINIANKAAKLEVEEAHLEKEIKHDELFCELVERYYGLVLSIHAVQVRKDVLGTMEIHMSEAEKLKNHGMIADAEFLHAKVYYSEAEREFKKAERKNSIVNDGLLNTLSVDSALSLQPVSKLFYVEHIESLEFYLQQGLEKSHLLAMVEHKKEMAHQGYRIERADFMPTVVAMGTYIVAEHELSPMIPDYFLGVGLTWTVFDGAARVRKVKAAKFQEEQVEDYHMQAKQNISMAIHKYYQEVNMQLEQLQDLESANKFAEEYYRVRKKAFNEGMATTTEVSDAGLAMAKVKIEKLDAIYKYDVALSKLLYYAGSLNEFTNYQNSADAFYLE